MFQNALTKVFFAVLSVIAVFANFFGGIITKNTPAPEGAIRVKYAEGACCWYNMYIPDELLQNGGETDILFNIHGGAWMFNTESDFDKACKEVYDHYDEYKMVAVTMDYSKFQNNADAEDMVNEIYTCVQSVKDELAARNITVKKMAVSGHSAGAHLSLLYSYQHYTDSPIPIAFVVSNCAPTEFIGDAHTKKTTMGKLAWLTLTGLAGEVVLNEDQTEAIAKVTPLTYITKDVPPTIVIQGNADEMVPFQNGLDLYAALQEAGVDTTFVLYEGAGHFLGTQFEKGNADRAAAFFAFAEKYF